MPIRDILIKHKLKVDKTITDMREDMKQTFEKRIFTKEGYKIFKKDREKFLMNLQLEYAAEMLNRNIPKLIKLSEKHKEELENG